jgi:hypothetical protein
LWTLVFVCDGASTAPDPRSNVIPPDETQSQENHSRTKGMEESSRKGDVLAKAFWQRTVRRGTGSILDRENRAKIRCWRANLSFSGALRSRKYASIARYFRDFRREGGNKPTGWRGDSPYETPSPYSQIRIFAALARCYFGTLVEDRLRLSSTSTKMNVVAQADRASEGGIQRNAT